MYDGSEKTNSLDKNEQKNHILGYLLSASYDGQRNKALLKFYDQSSKKIYFLHDDSGHLPYCLSDLSIDEVNNMKVLKEHPGLDHFEIIKKQNLLSDKEIKMIKIFAKDPLSIGGRSDSIRDIIPRSWESRISYHNSYIYDKGLQTGLSYCIEGGKLVNIQTDTAKEYFDEVRNLFRNESKEFLEYIEVWIRLFQNPIPKVCRVALDIEVQSPSESHFPNPEEANEQVISASICDSEGKKRVFLLKREGVKLGEVKTQSELNIEFFDDEEALLMEIFKVLSDYPVILTFNGDDFDFSYLYHRALKLGFEREKIPIILGRNSCLLSKGIHIDLYKFFFNRSIQTYAFGQRYVEFTLDEVSKALIGIGKIELNVPFPNLTYGELIDYCLRDAELTLKLTEYDDDLVMKLIFTLMRVTKLSMEDVTRNGVSNWIQNFLYFEHRRNNYLIPRPEDIVRIKGEATTQATIKGKKYRGAIVVKPEPGIHFDVSVLDFASLYPSIIKVYNLSYETILCPHMDCRDNKIPDLPHWVCKKKKGVSSLIIGSLRDIRVKWYKKKAKDKAIPESQRKLYDVVQLTLKVILNASYGVMGAENFELYCPPVAEAVTALGRYSIGKTIEKAGSLGIKVIYGDTDSVFLEGVNKKQTDELIAWTENELGMELEMDKFYRYSVFSNLKKNYLGVYDDGKVDIKGLTGKKRHMPKFLKSSFMEMIDVLGKVKTINDFEKAKDDIKKIIKACNLNLRNKHYSLEDLAFNIMISRTPSLFTKTTPQHVKAARLLENKGEGVRPGDIISFVKTTNNLGVKPIQLANTNEIDVEKYIDYLRSTFDQVLDALNINFNEILGEIKLDSFFN